MFKIYKFKNNSQRLNRTDLFMVGFGCWSETQQRLTGITALIYLRPFVTTTFDTIFFCGGLRLTGIAVIIYLR